MQDDLRARLEEVEASLAIREAEHLELDEVVRTLFDRLERLEREFQQLRAQVRVQQSDPLDLGEEKPPHY